MTNKYYYAVVLMFLAAMNVRPDSLEGIIERGSVPVSDANVIILELESITISDADGKFVFTDIPPGTYTIKVIAPSLDDKDFTVVVPSDGITRLELDTAEIIEEEVIIVTATQDQEIDSSQRKYTEEEIQILPIPNNNPFNIVFNDSGVVPEEKELGPPFATSPSEGSIYALDAGFSVYGGDSAWNKYYFNYIRIPTNYHPANSLTSVISREVVGSVTNYKGTPPGLYPPTLGGTTVIESAKTNRKNILLLGISPVDPRIQLNYTVNSQWSVFTAARQSIANYTVVPLANAIARQSSSTNPANNLFDALWYGDFVFTADYTGDINNVNITSLVFYDIITANSKGLVPEEEENAYIEINDLPVFGALGLSWERLIGANGQLALSAHFSLYDATKDSDTLFDGASFTYEGTIRSYFYNLKLSTTWGIGDKHVISGGSEISYNTLRLHHEYAFSFIPKGAIAPIFVLEPPEPLDITENIIENYYFFEYSYQGERVTSSTHAGLFWLPLHSTALASGRSNVSWEFAQGWALNLTVGAGPAIIDGIQFLDKRVNEETYIFADQVLNTPDSESIPRTKYNKPTQGVSSAIELSWNINAHRISIQPYFSYYYNFSSVTQQLFVSDPSGLSLGTYLTPRVGISTGGTFEWSWKNDINQITFSYSAGTTLYTTEEYAWVTPNTDIRHQIKFTYVFTPSKYFNLGLSGNVFLDRPFTPYTVVAGDNGGLREVSGDPFSARSLSPTFSLIPNISGAIFETESVYMNYRIGLGDLLAPLIINDRLLADENKVGASTANAADRKTTIEYLVAAVARGLEFTFELVIKL